MIEERMTPDSMDELLYKLLLSQLQSIGVLSEKTFRMEDILDIPGLPSFYKLWLTESFNLLTLNNYLEKHNDEYSVINTIDIKTVWKEWEEKKRKWDSNKSQIKLVEICLRALPDILRKKVLATDILFPNSSMELVEEIYKGNITADYFNEVLTDGVVAVIQNQIKEDPKAMIRIFEIGAGTGGTSAMLFNKLEPYEKNIREYCYTDISRAFLMHADENYGGIAPYLNPKIFNVELPLAEQGMESGGYDLAIATNVLHATKNIRNTLRNAKAILKKHGILFLNELSDKSLFTHLTFGLLEGWWLSEDTNLRIPGSPGLYPDIWQQVLEEEGFYEILFPAEESHKSGQQIIAAASDGIVRQQIKRAFNKSSLKIYPKETQIKDYEYITQKSNMNMQYDLSGIDVTDQMLEDYVRLTMRESIAGSLKMDQNQIQDDRSFSEYGVDSIIAVQLVNLINRQFKLTLQTTALFDYSSVDVLTKYITGEHRTSLINLLREKTPVQEKKVAVPESSIISNLKQEKEKHDSNIIYRGKRQRFYRESGPIEQGVMSNDESLADEVVFNEKLIVKNNPETSSLSTGISVSSKEPIAIIGMSGRFGKSASVNDLWQHLMQGDDLIEKVSRWDLDDYYAKRDKKEQPYCNYGSFLEDIDRFDPVFFNISGMEAKYMDPQQRIFLEESWKALEDAGYAGDILEGRLCGVYVGCSVGDYHTSFCEDSPAQALWGNAGSIIPARISYYLNLQGPAVALDTACSSSLVAIHFACQGLWHKETELALAGGIFIQSTSQFYLSSNKANMLSPTGRCYVFDERADGFVPGEGVGVVVLKRLSEAIADRDHIYGIIRGSGLNQDGRTNGITAPSAISQERLARQVYDQFQINPEQIQMVEAHGTGTKLGDPIEYLSLAKAFKNYTDMKEYCALGSIKSNIGHTVSAAGVAGLIKILLSLKHKQIPASLNYKTGNPAINFKDSPFYVNTDLKEWKAKDGEKRRAAISSFSISGTNAHMVIEEAPEFDHNPVEKPGYMIVLSAHTKEQLCQQAGLLVDFCEQKDEIDCLSMSYTLLAGRKHCNHRLGCVVRSKRELEQLLKKWLKTGKASQIYTNEIKEYHEQSALKNYGNQCIQDITRETDVVKYLEKLSAISELYIQGYKLDYKALFAKDEYSRISLPTYPFIGERYWVEEKSEVGELHPLLHQNTSFEYAALPSVQSFMPKKITLFENSESEENKSEYKNQNTDEREISKDKVSLVETKDKVMTLKSIMEKPKLSLDQKLTTDFEGKKTFRESPVELYEYENGIFNIKITDGKNRNRLTADIINGLIRSLEIIKTRDEAKVILLEGSDDIFLSEADEEALKPGNPMEEIISGIIESRIPIISVIKGNSKGPGLLIGLSGDFVVLSEEGKYHISKQTVKEKYQLILSKKYGEGFLDTEKEYTGYELKAKNMGMYISAKKEVDEYAMNLANLIARGITLAIRELKQHVKNELINEIDTGKPMVKASGNEWENYAEKKLIENKNELIGMETIKFKPVKINLDVMELKASANGILVVKMCDRESKNTFSEKFIKGITEVFEHIKNDKGYKAVILTGYDSYFICGGTKSELLKIQEGKVKFTDIIFFNLVLECEIPVIAAMQGHGIGAGWALGMFCDQIVFSEESSYVANFMEYGFTPGAGATLMFPECLGYNLGWELLFSAKQYKGKELKDRGIKYPVLPRTEVEDYALELANKLCSYTREELIDKKNSIRRELRAEIDKTYAKELAMHEKTFVGNEEVLKRIENHFNEGIGKGIQESIIQHENIRIMESMDIKDEDNDKIILEQIKKRIKKILGEELHLKESQIEEDKKFVDAGMDSISGVTFTKKISDEYGLAVAATQIYNHPTVFDLSKYILMEGKKQGLFLPVKKEEKQVIEIKKELKSSKLEFGNRLSGIESIKNRQIRYGVEKVEKIIKEEITLIAIIGMSGRYPDACNLKEYWANLAEGKNSIKEIPEDRWDINRHYNPETQKGKINCKWLGALDNIKEFDPLFFNISPIEAELMDPQQRIFLQEGYKAFEDAGYSSSRLNNKKCGVYLGIMGNEYSTLLRQNGFDMDTTGNSSAIAAARIAYYLNLKGPAISIDTACSSSLVAAHLAIQALMNKEIEMALVGGVSLYLTAEPYLGMCASGMLSPDGQCKTFDDGADGFVPGEGAGAVVFKRLEDAKRDKDFIYGVIIGSGINQDGKTNGITAPNGDSQADLIRELYQRYKIDPKSINYIETHGTGTKLGDPIEVEALSRVFGEDNIKKEYCALASVKSNIGHTSAAAGLAGIHKVLLALRHKKIPASLNFKKHNQHFDFKNSPFYINTELKDWEIEEGTKRRAGISSFGFSGTNAHIVMEEYLPTLEEYIPDEEINLTPVIIVLSAKSKEQVKEEVNALLENIKENNYADRDLINIAYTLQVGREAMEERLGLIVNSIEQLKGKLKEFLEGKENIDEVYEGHLKKSSEALDAFKADEDLQKIIKTWIEKRKYNKLADLWVKGLEIDWSLLYEEAKPAIISLPTYPFAKEKYWVEEKSEDGNKKPESGRLHPLLHQNTSDLEEQRFTSNFTGEEFFLRDHIVAGQKVLPGVAYLEMAGAAILKAVRTNNRNIQLENIVWIQPFVINEKSKEINISLSPDAHGGISYEIYGNGSSEDEEMIYSQGRGRIVESNEEERIGIEDIKSQCNKKMMTGKECYEAFAKTGISYGEGHRVIRELHAGTNLVLARLELPNVLMETKDEFYLHPSITDGALQAVVGLMLDKDITKPSLPYALEKLDIPGRCTEKMWAIVRYAEGNDAESNIRKSDIDICDEAGIVCIKMRGFTSRALEGDLSSKQVVNSAREQEDVSLPEMSDELKLVPVWNPIVLDNVRQLPASNEQIVIIGGNPEQQHVLQGIYSKVKILDLESKDTIDDITNKLKEIDVIDHIFWLGSDSQSSSLADPKIIRDLRITRNRTITHDQEKGVIQVFRLIKALLDSGYGNKALGLTVITIQTQAVYAKEEIDPTHAGLHGLIGTLAKEYPNWQIRLVDLPSLNACSPEEIITLPLDAQGNAIAYRDRQWFKQSLVRVQETGTGKALYRKNGVYVVIGGAGGVGQVWSKWMIEKYQAKLIWLGRRPENDDIRAKIAELSKSGSAPIYISTDATDLKSFQKAYTKIKRNHPEVNGVVHSAIVLKDQGLAKMEEEIFLAGLSAKVNISVNLANVFEKDALDFVLFFSSIMSFTRAAGQSNYAAGCTFEDAFGYWLNRKRQCPVKIMNWGYWGSVGVVAGKEYQDRMARSGFGSIEPEEGMQILEKLLSSQFNQMVFVKTVKQGAMEELDNREYINAYADNIPLAIKNVGNHKKKLKIKGSVMGLASDFMDELLSKLLLCQLQSIGMFTERTFDVESAFPVKASAVAQPGLPSFYKHWLVESINLLIKNNYLEKDNDKYSVIKTINMETVWQEWEQKKQEWNKDSNNACISGNGAQIKLVEKCLNALPDILRKKVLATDILFPNSSMELVEGIYKGNVIADYFNDVLTDGVIGILEQRIKEDPNATIRILEIGAGTGGTSAMLFNKLKSYEKHIREYCYTDISKAFLMHADDKYGQVTPYLNTQIFNVELPLSGQKIEADCYDIVIATNVLHATKNIRNTLRNAKAVLKKHGVLLLNELSAGSLFTHLTFGLLEGWWLYEDDNLRIPGSPGLYPAIWQRVLEEEGFNDVLFPAEESHKLGQQIIAASSDGIVRQQVRQVNKTNSISMQNKNIEIKEKTVEPPLTNKTEITNELLKDKCINYLKQMTGKTLKMPVQKISASEQLEKYGIDSILVVQLTNTLSKDFENITSTMFFEFQTIDAIAEHLVKTQRQNIVKMLNINDKQTESKEVLKDGKNKVEYIPQQSYRKRNRYLPKQEMNQDKAVENKIRDIAIIGLAGIYPGAKDMDEYWENLKSGKDCITEIPKDRWDWKKYYDSQKGKEGRIYSKWGGFIEDVDKFDPLFFNISPVEAERMDPQERLFLEIAYKCIQDAGYQPQTLCESKKVGVFVGVMNNDYSTSTAYWSIANRISYLLDFYGPSMSVDTACSSSLTAIHLALESLQSGISKIAIAGGVNLIITPDHYMALSSMNMLSSGDKCKSFGENADGFVDGEGVGAIILKPLDKAVSDGDHIYGVIKGSMLNAGGKTNGYTVPNPRAQSELILEAYRRSKINPGSISYIEAHGTGTDLGDPIEIAGLSKAFDKTGEDKQYCYLGSVKSNIGHLESAAGIAGVTKILLQLKHKKIVPSLHSGVLNPKIDFGKSPFIVNQELRDWTVQWTGCPRIAGINSFGAGGANAHLIIEEYQEERSQSKIKINKQNPSIIPLSAKNKKRLTEYVKELSSFLETHHEDLSSLAYTLQVGREAMEERLGLIVSTTEELKGKLKEYLEGKENIEGLYEGDIKKNKEALEIFKTDEEVERIINSCMEKQKYDRLMELWVRGFKVDWNLLYEEAKPVRISLPTYPFAKERYWVEPRKSNDGSQKTGSGKIHPLLHQNTSNLEEQRFTSIFTGEEFFLQDHVIRGEKMLPGAAYLEMARVAIENATGNNNRTIRLEDIVWERTFVVNEESKEINISLFPEEDDGIAYEIYGGTKESEEIYSQGRGRVVENTEEERLDIESIRNQCDKKRISGLQYYEAFDKMGIIYGMSHRVIKELYAGADCVLARLELPAEVMEDKNEYVLHPGMMDGALQSSICLIFEGKENISGLKPSLPFAIEKLEVSGKFTEKMWGVTRYLDKENSGSKIQKLDVDICDEDGRVIVKVRGFCSRIPEENNDSDNDKKQNNGIIIEPERREKIIENLEIDKELLREKALNYFKRQLSEVLKLSANRISEDESLEKYGIDSVKVMQLTDKLEKSFGELSKTLFFEYQTLKEITKYFLKNYHDKLVGILGLVEEVREEKREIIEPGTEATLKRRRNRFEVKGNQKRGHPSEGSLDIAIIGVSGRYPEAGNIKKYWENLKEGKDCIKEVPNERWNWEEYYTEDRTKPGHHYSKCGGFIKDVDKFDPLFFNISPREATLIDPQERLFMEEVWLALEDAGYTRKDLQKGISEHQAGQVGVYAGVMFGEYQLFGAEASLSGQRMGFAGNLASIANRVSYYLNIHGPSMTLDTMCSSSLTAIHLACQDLKHGRTNLGIAGGVNISIHPNKYLMLSMGQYISSKGHCESFGVGGDGYIPGEGVGVVILKRLEEAIRDKDQIYGIIRGSAINHGGKTNGYSVPNPQAQASVISMAIEEAGIKERSISYIEAHGTGTSLGDPIEISGLTQAFSKGTQDKQYCHIGSVKSNMGHCEGAAGIAGITKVLLQLKHKKIVPSLHSSILNPHIDFANSPFIVNQELRDWERPVIKEHGDEKESQGTECQWTECPRVAGISAFGAGGSNAHIIIEEYLEKEEENQSLIIINKQNPAIIIISAKSKEQVKKQARNLLDAIEENNCTDHDLVNIAYTLQAGREAMEERLGLIVSSIGELKEKLKELLDGKENIDEVYEGRVKKSNGALEVFKADEDLQKTIKTLIEKRKYSKLTDLWVKGLELDWNLLYEEEKPKKISLPAYPFAKEKYWVEEKPEVRSQKLEVGKLHPLLHRNTSTLEEERFTSNFSGEEFFLQDHIVAGQKVLPGVAYLEMARAAMEEAIGINNQPIQLENIVWTKPFVLNGGLKEINIALYPDDNSYPKDKDGISYEIYGDGGTKDEEIIYSQGKGRIINGTKEEERIDIGHIRKECKKTITNKECYEIFTKAGISYGESLRVIQELHAGENQVLARLQLPNVSIHTKDEFHLHPGIMDGALQSTIGLMLASIADTAGLKPCLPFALEKLEVRGKCTEKMWVRVLYAEGNNAQSKIQKSDIDICDEEGRVIIKMKGFTSRVLEGSMVSDGKNPNMSTMFFEPVWQEKEIVATEVYSYERRLVILCEMDKLEKDTSAGYLYLNSKEKEISKRYEEYSVNVFEEIRKIIQSKPAKEVLIQVLVHNKEKNQLFSGISGILKTAMLENPKIKGQLIGIEEGQEIEKILEDNTGQIGDEQIRYDEKNKRHVLCLKEIENARKEMEPIWKDEGVYLITGGLGGLGLIFAGEIGKKTKGVKLILTGRSRITGDGEEKLKELERRGLKVEYNEVDVTDEKEVGGLIGTILNEYGKLNGIIHSAGVTKDNFIIKKSKEEFREVMAPKVEGLINIDEMTKNLNLDFLILFSSMAGVIGNIGQSDYSSANAFMDRYSEYRNELVVKKERSGKTISINWPLWADGGMRIDEVKEKMMLDSWGMIPLKTENGIHAMYESYGLNKSKVMVVAGDAKLIKQKLLFDRKMLKLEKTNLQEKAEINGSDPTSKVIKMLSQQVSLILKVKTEDIDEEAGLNEYGFDSISLTEFANLLNQKYQLNLTPTIFFEYDTIRGFAGYLVKEHKEKFVEQLGVQQSKIITDIPDKEVKIKDNSVKNKRRSRFSSFEKMTDTNKTSTYEPIAIIGMSGKFPMAENLNEFWENLKAGKDCITEIPEDRWDWKKYYGDPLTEANKTNIKWGGFIDGISDFDPLFFGISPREAMSMDPQQRLLMTYVWHALEDAGYTSKTIAGTNAGIFIGTGNSGYIDLLIKSKAEIEAYTSTSLASSFGPNRMSYFLDIHGPSEPIETTCSSSLVAIHRAVNAIQDGTCNMSIAGGVNCLLSVDGHISFSKAGILSEDGRCKTFSRNANGYIRSEGVGILVLKKLKQAQKDRDHIYGVIIGSAENHGGRANSLTAPNPKAQAELLLTAYKKAGIDPRTVSYIEAHGTGTQLGDPIEINGLKTAFKELYREWGIGEIIQAHCALGSVKTNIGHLELAAGVAGVMKVLLELKHKRLVKSLHSEEINPYIELKDSPFYILQEEKEWETPRDEQGRILPRRAGISSFGIGGVNAHIVIEEYIFKKESSQTPIIINKENPVIIVLSAKSKEQVYEEVKLLLENIKGNNYKDRDLINIAYTLQIGREAMEERLGLMVSSIEELKERLKEFIEGKENIDGLYEGQVKRNKEALEVFKTDEDLQKAINSWIEKRKYGKLIDLWVKGLEPDWDLLYPEEKPERISLPTYPFLRTSYWIKKADDIQSVLPVIKSQLINLKNKELKINVSVKFMDESLYKLLFCQLQSLGLFSEKTFNMEDITNLFDLTGYHKKWLRQSINLLTENNYLKKNEDNYSVIQQVDINKVWQEWEEEKLKWKQEFDNAGIPGNAGISGNACISGNGAQIKMVETCLKGLPDILRNKVAATNILFPNASMELVERMYKDNVISDFFNDVLSDGVIAILQHRINEDPEGKIRILEIGAGTGGTSSMLFRKLQSYQEHIREYCYTDISKAFLLHAEENYRGIAPYLNPQIYNVELPLSGQNIDFGGYDMVIAANVLHATKNIKNTLRNAKTVLKKNGILFLNELSDRSLFGHLTFGLLEGWWLANDSYVRIKGSPGLYPATWKKVLEEEGFNDVYFPVEESHKAGQQIIAASSDGVVTGQINETDKTDSIPLRKKIGNSQIKDLPESEIERTIAKIWEDVLGIDTIGVNESFQTLGGDSIIATKVISRIEKSMPFELSLTNLFDATNIAGMAKIVENELIKKIEQLPEEEIVKYL